VTFANGAGGAQSGTLAVTSGAETATIALLGQYAAGSSMSRLTLLLGVLHLLTGRVDRRELAHRLGTVVEFDQEM
jgi:hypothetical protein